MKKATKFILLILLSFFIMGCEGIRFKEPNKIDHIDDSTNYPVSISVEPFNNKYKLFVGEHLSLSVKVLPLNSYDELVFSSSDESIATVDNNGVVLGISKGQVSISVKATKTLTSKKVISVVNYVLLTILEEEIPYTSVEIAGDNEVFVNEVIKFDLIKVPASANYQGTWSVDDQSIASIDQNGLLKTHSHGSVVITYYVNDLISASKTVIVKNRSLNVTSLNIITREIIEVDDLVNVRIVSLPRGSNNEVELISLNPDILEVTRDGKILGKSAGSATLVAISTINNLISSEINIVVVDSRISKISLEENIKDVIKVSRPSVIGVANFQLDNENKLSLESIGSGFIYKVNFILKDGSKLFDINELETFNDVEYFEYFLVTNRHVIKGASQVRVRIHQDEEEVVGRVTQYDDKDDVAIVTFNYTKYIKPLEFANSDLLEDGQFVIAIGNPSGFEFHGTATVGNISKYKINMPIDLDKDGVYDWENYFILHQTPINPGNSGGPLFDLNGKVVGVNTMKLAGEKYDNMGFSIPSNIITQLIPHLENGEKPIRAKIGITTIAIRDILNNPSTEYEVPNGIYQGLFVVDVLEGSIGEAAGILKNDIIVSFHGDLIKSTSELRLILNQITVGSNLEVKVIVFRNNEHIELTLVF